MPSRAPHPEQPLGGPVEQRDRLGRADPDHGVAQRGEDPDGARLGGPSVELRLLEGDAQRPDLLIELLDRTGDLAELTHGAIGLRRACPRGALDVRARSVSSSRWASRRNSQSVAAQASTSVRPPASPRLRRAAERSPSTPHCHVSRRQRPATGTTARPPAEEAPESRFTGS